MQEHADLSPPEVDAVIGAAFSQMRDLHWLDKERELFWVQDRRPATPCCARRIKSS
jgi:hypothetical protein